MLEVFCERGARLAGGRLAALALELVQPLLDGGEPLVESLETADALLQFVDPLAQRVDGCEDPVAAGRTAETLKRVFADVGKSLDDVLLLFRLCHGRIVTGAVRLRRAYVLASARRRSIAATAVAADGAQRKPLTLTVMTRNLYLGANLDAIVRAPSAAEAFAAVERGWAQVQANNFPARARAIAREIATAKPDFVGFQEAVLYRTQTPADFTVTHATRRSRSTTSRS